MTGNSEIPLFQQAQENGERTAIIASEGVFSYEQLLDASARAASCILNGTDDLREERVAFIVPPGFHYVAIQWGIWRAGGIAIPLCVFHPRPELEYVIKDSGASIIVAHPVLESSVRQITEEQGRRFVLATEAINFESSPLPEISLDRRALILYTSGTAGEPKGVVTTHKNIEAQVTALISAWEWAPDDHLLHGLPLHHCTGVVVLLTACLRAGAVCELLPRFNAEKVWERFIEGSVTLFMAIPTIYVKLISYRESASEEQQKVMSASCSKIRLMVSGSSALPVSVIKTWKSISGHTILERYGMTELAGAITYSLHDERIPGYVGVPLPGVEARLIDDNGKIVQPGEPGEIQIRGPLVFLEYWGKPDITKSSFQGEWFSTGDIAVVENGLYRIIGRSSLDIIKTGGYKVSSLEIEGVLRTHPGIEECSVVGIEDPEWGECVSAALVLKKGSEMTLESLRTWAKERLAVYKVPAQIRIFNELPRTPMGKVYKMKVRQLLNDKK